MEIILGMIKTRVMNIKKTLSIVIQRKYAPIISNTKLKATL